MTGARVVGRALLPFGGVILAGVGLSALGAASSPAPRTIGLAITTWRNAFVETSTKEECGGKLQPGEIAQFKATPGSYDRVRSGGGTYETRGINGETGNHSPLTVPDYLPFVELTAKTGFGFNLDGTQDGRATAKSRKHEKFTSAEGEKVDHELARVLGCVQSYRTGGITSDYYANEVGDHPINRLLLEITGVDDEKNDPSVQVTIYKGQDRLLRKGDGKFMPNLSQRIDERFPQYTHRLRGKIVDGTLITEPVSRAVFPHSSMRDVGERDMRDMSLRLKLTDDGAEGLLAGYENWRKWYNIHSKKLISGPGNYSSPSIYRALQRYADGYPDPKTGEFTYISATYQITAIRALVVHPQAPAQRIAAQDRVR